MVIYLACELNRRPDTPKSRFAASGGKPAGVINLLVSRVDNMWLIFYFCSRLNQTRSYVESLKDNELKMINDV